MMEHIALMHMPEMKLPTMQMSMMGGGSGAKYEWEYENLIDAAGQTVYDANNEIIEVRSKRVKV